MRSDDAVQEARDFEPFHPIQKCPKIAEKKNYVLLCGHRQLCSLDDF